MQNQFKPGKYRTIWISDVHLGFRDSKAEFLLDFLNSTEAETIFIVGDLIDIWSMKKTFFWPEKHQEVIKTLINKVQSGTRVIYIPGNHDEINRDLVGAEIFGVEIHRNYVHTTADGRKFLLCHGDEFDFVVRHSTFVKIVGDLSYGLLLFLNRWCNRFRKCSGQPYWSLATYIKNRIKNARKAIEVFEEAAAAEARHRGLDGIICGHIHQPEIRKIDGVLYCNDGDWVESCTAMAENQNGWLEIIHWADIKQSVKKDQAENLFPIPISRLPTAA